MVADLRDAERLVRDLDRGAAAAHLAGAAHRAPSGAPGLRDRALGGPGPRAARRDAAVLAAASPAVRAPDGLAAAGHDQREPQRGAHRRRTTPTRSRRLSDIADAFLLHDRPIHVRCDDSVAPGGGRRRLPIRRSRGYAPFPVRLPFASPPGARRGRRAQERLLPRRAGRRLLSPHIGDLENLETYVSYEGMVERMIGALPGAARGRGPRPPSGLPLDPLRARARARRCRGWPCSTTTPTSRRAWPSTGSRAR